MSYFIYDKPVTGKNFVGRKNEVTVLGNMISQGENVAIYEPAKTGKHSVLNQALFNLKVATQKFSVVRLSLLNIRNSNDLILRLGSEILRSVCVSEAEFEDAVSGYLPDTHFVFDKAVYADSGEPIALNWDIDENDIFRILSMPYALAADNETKIFVVLDEFQNILLLDDGEKICSILLGLFRDLDFDLKKNCSYIFLGSEVNAMKEIFEVRKLFYRQVVHLKLPPVDEKLAVEHVIKGFLAGGKVLDRELATGLCKAFGCNMWYLNYFASLCDTNARGYVVEPLLLETMSLLLSIHEPRFVSMMNSLTTYQVGMLKAVLDGHKKFSSAEVIHKYGLNSSANVKRVREALCKKEIITFDQNDEPQLLDPLFEYWVRRTYFGMKV